MGKAPKSIKKTMSDKQKKRAHKVRPFAQYVNVRHILTTRFSMENSSDLNPEKFNLGKGDDTKKETASWDKQKRADRKTSLKAIKEKLEARWNEGVPKKKKEAWFFQRLRF